MASSFIWWFARYLGRFFSMYNLHELIHRADDEDCDFRILYEDMASHEINARVNRMGCPRNVNDLTAHNIVSIITKVILMRNVRYIRSATTIDNSKEYY